MSVHSFLSPIFLTLAVILLHFYVDIHAMSCHVHLLQLNFLLFIFTLISNTHNITAGPVAVQLCLGAFEKPAATICSFALLPFLQQLLFSPLLITRYFCITLNYLF